MSAAATGLTTGVITTVLDCEDPGRLATFWSGLLQLPTTAGDDDGWAELEPTSAGVRLAFQRVARHRPPGRSRPQQLHMDIEVADLDTGEQRVLELGGTLLRRQEAFRVFTDPAGHPFCLVTP